MLFARVTCVACVSLHCGRYALLHMLGVKWLASLNILGFWVKQGDFYE